MPWAKCDEVIQPLMATLVGKSGQNKCGLVQLIMVWDMLILIWVSQVKTWAGPTNK